MTPEPISEEISPKKSRGKLVGLLILIIILLILWFLFRPGIFVIQPIGALPDGVTIVYHSRNYVMPFISSPDGLCLEYQGSVTLLCRLGGIGAAGELMDRKIIKLPYMRWLYLRSTGGLEFD